MKSSLKKLRDLAVTRPDALKEASYNVGAEEEEPADLTQGMKDLENMQAQYEGLLTCGQMISGAVYDFSRAIQEMASCMLETFSHFVDPETENVFSMLAKVQFEISKLLDLFAAHVSQSIICPAQMMISELQQVEVMKDQYDEKRKAFNLTQRQMQKRHPQSGKGADFRHQLASAKADFNEQALALSFRLQSLKQGQPLSLITQAARYHYAQMHLFSKGLASIGAMEPMMDQITSKKNIDKTLSQDDITNDASFRRDSNVSNIEGDDNESLISSPTVSEEPHTSEAQVMYSKVPNCKSGPISLSHYQKDGPIERDSTQKYFATYALPSPTTPSETHGTELRGNVGTSAHEARMGLPSWEHKEDSSTTQKNTAFQKKVYRDLKDEGHQSYSIRKIGRSFSHSGRQENTSFSNILSSSHVKQIDPLYKSGPISRTSVVVTHISHSDLKISPRPISPPQISELHKLPPPPSPKVGTAIPHSGPLPKMPSKSPPLSPLPAPPALGSRSLPTPASTKHATGFHQHGEDDLQDKFPFSPIKSVVSPSIDSHMSN